MSRPMTSLVVVAAVACAPGGTTSMVGDPIVMDPVVYDTDASYVEPAVDPETFDSAQIGQVAWDLNEEYETLITVAWDQQVAAPEAWVEFSFDKEPWERTPRRGVLAGPQQQLLLGIPYETDVKIRIVNDWGAGPQVSEEFEARTGDFPDDLPLPEMLAYDEDQLDPSSRFLVTSINRSGGWTQGDYWKFIVDRKGRVVWASETPGSRWTIFMREALSGTEILWDEATWWSNYDLGDASTVHRMKIDGTIVETLSTPGLHHAFSELPGGELIWGDAGWSSEELVQFDQNGDIEVVWDCDDFHDLVGTGSDCQSNTIYHHQEDDTVLYSFYTTNSVVQVDRQTGESINWWGNLDGPWTFEPPESQFWWQHGVHFLPNGNILLSTHCERYTNELCVREYRVDYDNQVLRQVWHFGEGEGIMAATAGEAHRLDNGNTLHNGGSSGRMREITHDGQVVWDLNWRFGSGERLLGRSYFVPELYRYAP